MFGRKKRKPRRMANLRAQMREGEDWKSVVLVNVAPTGAMVKCQDPPGVGDSVEIQHRGLTINGEVIWSTRSRFGMKSEGEIDLNHLFAESDFQHRSPAISAPIREQRWWHWRSRR